MIVIPDNLENRFLQPEGWTWRQIVTDPATKIRRLRIGEIQVPNPKGKVYILPGRCEYAEKYFETVKDLMKRDLNVYIIDWFGQGGSARPLPDPEKDHVISFETHIEDMHSWIHETDDGRPLPRFLLGHSMGGHIGLRYLARHKDVFNAAIFSAPMCGILAARTFPKRLRPVIAKLISTVFKATYLPGSGNWKMSLRPLPGTGIFSSDAKRDAVHDSWLKDNPHLRIGSPTGSWIYAAIESCLKLSVEAQQIETPCSILMAGQEALVDNQETQAVAALISKAKIQTIDNARHEILMENDIIRHAFLKAFDSLIKDHLH